MVQIYYVKQFCINYFVVLYFTPTFMRACNVVVIHPSMKMCVFVGENWNHKFTMFLFFV